MRALTKYLFVLVAALPAMLTSCESPTTTVEQRLDSTTVGANDRAFFVLNEGQYLGNDGSLDVVIIRGGSHDTIIDRNVLKGLGVGNAVHVFGNNAYVVDNAGNQVLKLSADSLKTKGAISFGTDSPNDITDLGSNKALVTLLYTPKAKVIDLTTMTELSAFDLPEGSGSAAVLNNKAYITTSTYGGGSHVVVYDLAQAAVTKSIPLLRGAGPIAADSAHNRIVIGSVGIYDTTGGRVYWLDPTTDALVDSINTTSTQASLVFMTGGSKAFLLDGGSPARLDLGSHALVPLGLTGYFYNGAYDPKTDQLFLGHNDFSGNPGAFEVYGATDLVRHWTDTAGIAPAHFAFYH